MSGETNSVGAALDEIERSILPGLAQLLDSLLDSASLARPGVDAEIHAAQLRETAHQVSGLAWLIEAVAPFAQAPSAAPRRISA